MASVTKEMILRENILESRRLNFSTERGASATVFFDIYLPRRVGSILIKTSGSMLNFPVNG